MIKGMTANELDLAVKEQMRHFDIEPLMDHYELVGDGQKQELRNLSTLGGNLYYQWLSCLVRVLRPKQVVELGAAGGISTIAIATQLSKDAKLYSVDIDPSIAWKWIKYDYPQVVKILGDDLHMQIWPGFVDLGSTDIWFIDTLHTKDQLTKELDLYKPYFKKGAVVVLDDIRMPGLWEVWEKLPYDKFETSNPNHHTGFGHFIV